jgi:hypothetical protein
LLDLRIVKGPLEDRLNEVILSEYNRLTSSHISSENLRRWTQESPEGPACHALLNADGGELVGHCCLFPFRMKYGNAQVTAAKAEYYFINENYRTERIHGFERSDKPAAVILLEQLYRYCRMLHWGPYIISAPKGVDVLHRMAGCRAITFPLFECLLVLRPWRGSSATPNLTAKQRTLLFLTGVVQGTVSSAVLPFSRRLNDVRSVSVTAPIKPARESSVVCLAEDEDFLGWRYPESQYFRVGTSDTSENFLIAKNGSASAYLRVCQYRLDSDNPSLSCLLVSLARSARAQQALGLRWAVYDQSERPAQLVHAMRKLGFLCARRERNFLLYTDDRELLAPGRWNMADSLLSFDN